MKENVKVLNIVAWADQITFLFMTKKMISFARRISSLMDDPKKIFFYENILEFQQNLKWLLTNLKLKIFTKNLFI